MSKNLRVFFLSVLIALFAVSSAFAADLVSGDGYGISYGDGVTIRISADGTVRLPDTIVSIDLISLDTKVTNAVLVLPMPTANALGNGTAGHWRISMDAPSTSTTAIQKLAIQSGHVNASILLSGDMAASWNIPRSADLTIDLPIRAEGDTGFGISIDIAGKLTFGPHFDIYGNAGAYTSDGFTKMMSSIDVKPYGMFIVEKASALHGSLDVYVESGDVPGIIEVRPVDSNTHDLKGAKLTVDGIFRVSGSNVLTLTGGPILVSAEPQTFTKDGTGTLIMGTDAFSGDITRCVRVLEGKLTLNGTAAFDSVGAVTTNPSITSADISFDILDGAVLELTKHSVEQGPNGKVILTASDDANIILNSHAIFAKNGTQFRERYPHEGYTTEANGMTIDVSDVRAIVIGSSAKITVNGIQAFTQISGDGIIEVNGTDGYEDNGVLILYSASAYDYVDFAGTINGTNANVGLCSGDYSADIFEDATLVSIDNLLVYGSHTTLSLSSDTLGNNNVNVGSVYLRSDRPGKDEYKVLKLSVGQLNLVGPTPFTLSGLKIDATMAGNYMAVISPDQSADVTLKNVLLYANRDTDFEGAYPTENTGMYAVKLGAGHSRITLDADTLEGNGEYSSITNEVFSIQVAESGDLIVTGSKEYPFGYCNSVFVAQDGKLEVYPDSRISGDLMLEGSTADTVSLDAWMNVGNSGSPSPDVYPYETWFYPYYGDWNAESLDQYTVFTTTISKKNRVTNGGNYAVVVEGNLNISYDVSADTTAKYPAKVLVRGKANLNLLDGSDNPLFEHFKVLGTLQSTADSDFLPVYNAVYGFRITEDKQGVTFGLRSDVAQLALDGYTFTQGDENKLGDGSYFDIKIFFDVDPEDTFEGYYDASNEKYVNLPLMAYFAQYADGMEEKFTQTNIYDEKSTWFTQEDGTVKIGANDMRATLVYSADVSSEDRTYGGKIHAGYIRLQGRAYAESIDLSVAIASGDMAVNSTRVVPSYKRYTFGAVPDDTLQWSIADITPQGKVDFTVNEDANVVFQIGGNFRKAAYGNITSVAELQSDGTYAWNVKALPGTYVILDSNGKEQAVTDFVAVLFDNFNDLDVSEEIADGFTISDTGLVTIPLSLLKSKSVDVTALTVTRGVSVKAKAMNFDIITNPVAFTIRSTTASDVTELTEWNQTVTIGVEPEPRFFEIDPDVLSGKIKYDTSGVPSWVGFSGSGNIMSYEIKDLTGVAPGTYTFNVLAYVGDNVSTNTSRKLYTFTITVEGTSVATLTANPANLSIETGTTGSITFTVSGGEADYVYNLPIYGIGTVPADLIKTTETTQTRADTINIVGNGSATIAVDATSVEAGTYRYHVGGNYDIVSADFTITVTVPPEASVTINEEDNQFSTNSLGYTYHAVFSAAAEDFEGTAPEIEWSVSTLPEGLYSFTSTDVDDEGNTRKLFVVEGVIRGTVDDTKTFTVNAKAGSVDAEPYVVEYTIDADPYAEEVTYPNVEGITITGDSTAVTTGYRAMLPARTASTSDTDVTLPLWLKPVYDEDENIIGVEFAGVTGNLANGSTATVRIYAEYTPDEDEELDEDDDGYRYYGWDVTYAARPADLALTLSSTNVSLLPGGSQTVTATVTNAQGTVTYKLADGAPEWVTINAATGVVSVTAPADEGTYTVTVIAQDSRGADGQAAAELTITVSDEIEPPVGQDFMLTSTGSTTLSVALNATNTSITLTPRNVNGTVTYTPSVTWVTVNSSTGVVTINPTDASLVGTTQTVTITAKDSGAHASGKDTDSVTLTITVTSGESSVGQDLMLTASGDTRITVALNTVNTSLTLVPRNVVGTVTYSSSADWVDVDEDSNVSIYPTEASLVSTTAHSVTITATDSAAHANGGSNTATITLTITVTNRRTVGSSGGGGCDAGFGALALVLAAPLFLRRRRS